MAQPNPYDPATSFVSFEGVTPTFPGQELDVELAAIEATLDQTLANLALIQRDDGRLRNGIVDFDALDPILQAGGIYPLSTWATAHAYIVNQVVISGTSLYKALVSHISGTFATDLAAAKWLLLVALPAGPIGPQGASGLSGLSAFGLAWGVLADAAAGRTALGVGLTQGSVIFSGPSGVLSQDNANLFWDSTRKMLGVGTATPFVDNNNDVGFVVRNDNSGITRFSVVNRSTNAAAQSQLNLSLGATTGANFTMEIATVAGAPVAVLLVDTPSPAFTSMSFAAPAFVWLNTAQTVGWANLTGGTFTLGDGATTLGQVALKGTTSGTATIRPQTTAGTPTLTLGTNSGTPVVTASSPLSIAAATGDISLGQISLALLPNLTTQTLYYNATGGTTTPTAQTPGQMLDNFAGNGRGSILERGASAWTAVLPGAAGLPWVSNGVGTDPAYQLLGLSGGGTNASTVAGARASLAAVGSVITQVFTASGTYTPTSGMLYALLECFGAGGAGGGVTGTAGNTAAGGGGGAGSYARIISTAATIGASQTVTIGAAGTGVSAGNGNAGGDTSVGAICIGKGGGGGSFGQPGVQFGAAGAGGVAGTGTYKPAGRPGEHGFLAALTSIAVFGGKGGDSIYGAGANGGVQSGTGGNDGNAAPANSGSGGSGAVEINGTNTRTGGAGGSGFVMITEFCA